LTLTSHCLVKLSYFKELPGYLVSGKIIIEKFALTDIDLDVIERANSETNNARFHEIILDIK